jgi:Recombinase/Recombinase zinc beta ribbon domain
LKLEVSVSRQEGRQSGVEVFETSGAKKGAAGFIQLSTPIDKMLAAAEGFAGEMQRHQVRVTTHRAMALRAKTGRSTGGKWFGFISVCAACETPTGPHGRRCLCEGATIKKIRHGPAVAAARRVFELYNLGHGTRQMARILNAESVPSPRGRGWTPTTIRFVVSNPLYIGQPAWNKVRRRDDWGVVKPTRRDASEIIVPETPVEEFRIIDAATWEHAQARRAAGARLYGANARATDRAPSPIVGKYLIGGLATCATCRGSMFSRSRGNGRDGVFGCRTHFERGDTHCTNRLRVQVADVEAAVIAAVEQSLLQPEVLAAVIDKAVAAFEPTPASDVAAPIRKELDKLDGEVERLTTAIAEAQAPLEGLLAGLQSRERRRAELRAALQKQERQQARQHGRDEVLAAVREAIRTWQQTLHESVPAARRTVQALVTERLLFTPAGDRYTFEAAGTAAPIVAGIVPAHTQGSEIRSRQANADATHPDGAQPQRAARTRAAWSCDPQRTALLPPRHHNARDSAGTREAQHRGKGDPQRPTNPRPRPRATRRTPRRLPPARGRPRAGTG